MGSLNRDQETHYRSPDKKIWLKDGTTVTFFRFDAAPVFGCVAIGIGAQTPDGARTIEYSEGKTLASADHTPVEFNGTARLWKSQTPTFRSLLAAMGIVDVLEFFEAG